jgi:uncharacterized protein (TIGR03437 family)
LYGGALSTGINSIISINPANGTASTLAAVQGSANNFWGLAPVIPSGPTINANGVVPIYSTSTTIQPGSWVTVYGSNFSGSNNLWQGDFPTTLGQTTVTINGKPAYLWLVSPTQINLQAPDDTMTGSVSVVVSNQFGNASAAAVLGPYGPSFSLLDSRYAASIVLTSGSAGNSGAGYDIIGPTGRFPYPTRPVKAGETLVLFGTGFGPTNPPVPAGKAFSGAALSTNPPQITIGGVPAMVNFAGIIEAGLFQFNVVVPAVGSGDQPIQALAGGLMTPGQVFIAVQ